MKSRGEVEELPTNRVMADEFMQFVGRDPGKFTFRELQIELAQDRGRRVPRSTLQKWMEVCNFAIKREGYTHFHLDKLRALTRFMNARGSRYEDFQIRWNAFITEVHTRGNCEQRESAEPIEVNCIRV